MTKSISFFILTFLSFQFASGQLIKNQLEDGYHYYNSRAIKIAPDKTLPSQTLNPNKIEFVCKWMNMDSIMKNFESQRVILNNKFQHLDIDLNSVFGAEEIHKLNQKFQNLESVQLDKKKLNDVYKLRGSSYFEEAFPIIQKGKDAELYAFIYEEARFSKAFGRMKIEKQVEDDWLWFGSVRIPRFDIVEITEQMKNLPEEYQVINSFLIGKNSEIQSEFIPINGGDENYDRYSEFDTWNQIQNSSLDENVDVRKHFSKSNLESVAGYLNSKPKGSIDEKLLLGNLKSIKTSKITNSDSKYGIYRMSKPFVFYSDLDDCNYAVFYWSKVNGPLNGSGNILVMRKEKGRYVKFISHMLWIS